MKNDISKGELELVRNYMHSRKRGKVAFVTRTVEITNLPRERVIAVFKQLEKEGLGEFVVGRKGYSSRFEWHKTTAGTVFEIPLREGAARASFVLPSDLTPEEALFIGGIFMDASDKLRASGASVLSRAG